MTISKDDTIILDGGGDKSDIESRCDQIRDAMDNASSDYDRCVSADNGYNSSSICCTAAPCLLQRSTVKLAKSRCDHHCACTVLVCMEDRLYIVPGLLFCTATAVLHSSVCYLQPLNSI